MENMMPMTLELVVTVIELANSLLKLAKLIKERKKK